LEKARAQLEESRAELEQLPLVQQQLRTAESELQQEKEKATKNARSSALVEELQVSERRLREEVVDLKSKALDHMNDRLKSETELRAAAEKSKAETEEAKDAAREEGTRAGRLEARLQELERLEQELRAENRSLAEDKAKLVAQREEQERYLHGRLTTALDTARRLDEEKRAAQAELSGLRAEVARSRRTSQEAARGQEEAQELRTRCARLEDQLRREVEKVSQLQQLQQQQLQQQQQPQHYHANQSVGLSQEQQAALQRAVQVEREYKAVVRAFEEQKKDIETLESTVRECKSMSNLCTNGELRRMIKAYEDESLAAMNSSLKTALVEVQSNLSDCKGLVAERDQELKELRRNIRRGGM